MNWDWFHLLASAGVCKMGTVPPWGLLGFTSEAIWVCSLLGAAAAVIRAVLWQLWGYSFILPFWGVLLLLWVLGHCVLLGICPLHFSCWLYCMKWCMLGYWLRVCSGGFACQALIIILSLCYLVSIDYFTWFLLVLSGPIRNSFLLHGYPKI